MNHTVKDRKKSIVGVLVWILFAVLAASVPKIQILAAGEEITSSTMMKVLSKVNVRREPDTSAEVLGQLESGEKIFAVELTQEGWYRVAYQGETGYVRKDFLEVYTAGEEWNESLGEDVLTQSQTGEQGDAGGETDAGQGTQPEAWGGSSASQGTQPENAGESDAGQESPPENTGESAVGQEVQPDDSEGSAADQGTQQGVPEAESGAQEADSEEHKSGISNVLILGLTGAVILVYAAFQVLKERRKGPDAAEKGQEKSSGHGGRRDSQGTGGRGGLTFLDLEEEKKNSLDSKG